MNGKGQSRKQSPLSYDFHCTLGGNLVNTAAAPRKVPEDKEYSDQTKKMRSLGFQPKAFVPKN